MNGFPDLLREQINRHPSMRPRDIVKLCYQAAFGAEHLLENTDEARAYFFNELEYANETGQELFERISPDILRVNLSEWKQRKIPGEWLFTMFEKSARQKEEGDAGFYRMISEAGELINKLGQPFSYDEWHSFIGDYIKDGVRAIRHSEEYRENEKPNYRLVDAEYLRAIPLLERLAMFTCCHGTVVIAIDGRAASGKTTLALRLSEILGAGVAHTDDFFLPAELRTESRLSEPGGNIHYERFIEELLPRLRGAEAFSYRLFDCGAMRPGGLRQVNGSHWRIVEGAYSAHPKFGNYADMRMFSDIAPEAQMERIKIRDGERAGDFAHRWIPMEEAYFLAFEIRESSDIVLN